MKNSLKFLTAAGLLLLGSLTAYNAALHSTYRLGAYKNPLLNYDLQSQRNFRTVHLPAAGIMSARIEEGPFGVYVNKEAADFVRVTQQGTQLTVALAFAEKVTTRGPGAVVIIRCPRLDMLTAGTTYTVDGRPERIRTLNFPNSAAVVVSGFQQDTLRLVQDDVAHVVLANNRLGHLQALVGQSPGSTAQLDLKPSNALGSADIRVDKRGKMKAENVALPKLRWQYSDSAQVEMTGASLGSIARQ